MSFDPVDTNSLDPPEDLRSQGRQLHASVRNGAGGKDGLIVVEVDRARDQRVGEVQRRVGDQGDQQGAPHAADSSPTPASAAPHHASGTPDAIYPRKKRMRAKTMSGNTMISVRPMSWSTMNGITPR